MSAAKKSKDSYSYHGWLHSDNFFKRSFSVWLHWLVAHLIISVALFAILYLLGRMAGVWGK